MNDIQAMLSGGLEQRQAVATLYVYNELSACDRTIVTSALERDGELGAMVRELATAAETVDNAAARGFGPEVSELAVGRALRATSRHLRQWSVERVERSRPKPVVRVIRWTWPEMALVAALVAVTATVAIPAVTSFLRDPDRNGGGMTLAGGESIGDELAGRSGRTDELPDDGTVTAEFEGLESAALASVDAFTASGTGYLADVEAGLSELEALRAGW